jgi:glycosyltransferase involved in cell wall biosynthesis
MRILIAHNRYQQEGGEDGVVRAEAELLRKNGNTVELLEEDNSSINGLSQAVRTAAQCVYSFRSADRMREVLSNFRPDLVHIHNFFPKLSPSIHHACYRAGVPVVQTLHNFRLLCSGAYLLRDGKVCEDCVGRKLALPGVQHRCYRNSTGASAAVAAMQAVHRALGTWSRTVARFIVLTEFARKKFSEGGLPLERMVVKPNFLLSDPGEGPGDGGYALFVGRLSEEKGLKTLLSAWRQLSCAPPLKIVGDGPMAATVRAAEIEQPAIQWLGRRSSEEVRELMAHAAVLVFPSTWYEGFPLVFAEASAAGLPILATRLGAMQELIEDGRTGLLFSAGDATALARQVEHVFSAQSPLASMRPAVRATFEARYTAEKNYAMLMEIYRSVCTESRRPAILREKLKDTSADVAQPLGRDTARTSPAARS